jgi:hypothetical protein
VTRRERGIAIITALTAQGVTDDRLATHIRLARQNGLDQNALTALMILLGTNSQPPDCWVLIRLRIRRERECTGS